MSGEPSSDASAQMIDSILADADVQIRKLQGEARAAADAELAKIDQEAKAIREEIVNRAKDKAQRLQARGQAVAMVEARRILLQAREAALQTVLKRVEAQLAAVRDDIPTYRMSLLALSKEALCGIAAPSARLSLAEADRAVVDAAFVEALKADVTKRTKAFPEIDIRFEPADLGGGCVARSRNGRIVFDNTFTGRFGRAQRSLRATILKEAPTSHE